MATLALNSGLWVRRLLMGGGPLRGGVPPQRLTMGPVQKTQTTSGLISSELLDSLLATGNFHVNYEPARVAAAFAQAREPP